MGKHHTKTVVVVVVVEVVPVPRPAAFWRVGVVRRDDRPVPSVACHAPQCKGRACRLLVARRAPARRTGLRLTPAAEQPTDLVGQADDMRVLADGEQIEGLALAQQQA